MRNPHELDLAPPDYWDLDAHASDCGCGLCVECHEADEIPVPSEAELERMYAYEMARKRSA